MSESSSPAPERGTVSSSVILADDEIVLYHRIEAMQETRDYQKFRLLDPE